MEIDGFQSLVGVKLTLAPGVNVVVGESDVGKSAIVRAIQGLIGNQRGDGFVNNRTGRCRVSMRVPKGPDDTATILWKKPENSYQIDDDDPFKKVGATVPKEVLALVNMAPLELDKNLARSINIVEQSAPKFLVEDKETDVAKTIGAITRLQPVYNAMRAVAADRRSALGRAKTLASEAAQSRLKLAAFSDLEAEAKRLKRAKAAVLRCGEAHDRLTKLLDAAARLRRNADESEDIRRRLELVAVVLVATEHVKIARLAWKNRTALRKLQNGLLISETASKTLATRLAEIESLASMDISGLGIDGERVSAMLRVKVDLSANASSRTDLDTRVRALGPLATLDIGALERGADELDRMDQLGKLLASSSSSIVDLGSEAEAAERGVQEANARMTEFLASASICPLSGGQLFEECKQLIGGEAV